jgi:polysaccharide deacetylase 2 family uncharacterized protein YibQ
MARPRSKKARYERRTRLMSLLRVWAITIAAAVVVVLGVIELVSSGGGPSLPRGLGAHRGLSHAVAEIDRAVDGTLVKMGVAGVAGREEERSVDGRSWIYREQSGRLPYGMSLFECNLTLTGAVRDAGGKVLRAVESEADWRGLKTLTMRIGAGDIETHSISLAQSLRPEGYRRPGRDAGVAPKVAIVIDDFGNNSSEAARAMMSLDYPITVSILPGCPHTESMAEAARRSGKEIMAHVPMEPQGFPENDPGEGALRTNGTREQIESALRAALDGVPHAVGVNNHMGSSFTASRIPMRVVMQMLKRRGLYFLDSMTTPESVGVLEAERAGVPAARNRMFIDSPIDEMGRMDPDAQLEELMEIARELGSAVGIGHPYPETLRALETALPAMEREGVELVFVSELTE